MVLQHSLDVRQIPLLFPLLVLLQTRPGQQQVLLVLVRRQELQLPELLGHLVGMRVDLHII